MKSLEQESMFDKSQYVVEKTLESPSLEAVRDAYNVRDAYGNLLGYIHYVTL